MKSFLLYCALLFSIVSSAQISITTPGAALTENFNSLAATGTTGSLPAGWLLLETGANANTTYTADNGGVNSGNTYSYGTTGATERAFGGLQSGNVIPTLGVAFTNNTGGAITSLAISYTGEMWRAGLANRNAADRLDFQYSTDATSLGTGTWTDENALDFLSPIISVPAAIALDGNAAANRTNISFTINGLNIPNGATFYLRWNDFNITSSDDGLAIDDFSLTANGSGGTACVAPTAQATGFNGSNITTTGFTANWTHAVPQPNNYLVTLATTADAPAAPVNGTAYAVGNSIGSTTVVYKGNSNSATISGLNPGTPYWLYIWSLNDACTGGPLYQTTAPLSGTVSTNNIPVCASPIAAPTAIVLTPSITSVSGSYTVAAGADSYLVVYSTNSNPGFTPVDASAYSVDQTIGSVTVAKTGTGNSFSANGLAASSTYYFFVYSMNSVGCTGGPIYFNAPLSGSTTTLASGAGIPAGYYDIAAGKSCADLKTALNSRTSNTTAGVPVTPKTYTDLWSQYLISDVKPREVGTGSTMVIWDVYSDNPTGADPYNFTPGPVANGGQQDNGTNVAGEGMLYNREHTVPLDWFDGNTNNNGPATDYFHIMPTDKIVNANRSSFIYGEVTNPTITSLNGSKLGPNAFAGLTGTAFEPINEYKGDIARAFLYFVTRYETSMASFTGGNEGTKAFEPNTFPSVDIPYLQLMLKWHHQDPVSAKELDRNDAGFVYQGNRNPYIDHPEYVDIVWNSTCAGLGALPIHISWFKGTLKGADVELNWATEAAVNFRQFEIQRSVNGSQYETIGTVKGSNARQFTYADNVAKLGGRRLYYRLKMVDNDGSFAYSAIYSVHIKAQGLVQVYPNPASNNLYIQLGNTSFSGTITISDMAGRTLMSKQVSQVSGTISLPVHQLGSGRYQLKLASTNAGGISSTVPINIVR
ncbi:MAG TPA: endonuclease [Phnomibacter sp.]|nr:endonuclease [Phnomibacter sp.]